MNETTLIECRDKALRLLLDYKSADQDTRTPIVRQLAEVIVDARSRFLNDESEPDWKGLTHAYRTWLHDVYTAANFSKDDTVNVQAAVRYHVGAVLRQRLDKRTLRRLGLLKQTPKERSKERRLGRTAVINALTGRHMTHGGLLALSAAYTMLSNVTDEDFADLPRRDREAVAVALDDIARRVEVLRRAVSAR